MDILVEQSKLPQGRLGRAMLNIMGWAHNDYALWALDQLPGGEKCLELSCGAGRALRQLAATKKYDTVYGIDLSDEALKAAIRNNSPAIQAKAVLLQKADVQALPYADASFDDAFTIQSHYHWPNVEGALAEVRRVLKPGGRFVLVSEVVKLKYHLPEYLTPEANTLLLENSGFKDVRLMKSGNVFCLVAHR